MSFHFADAIFWIAVACCSVAQVAILYSVISSPARTSDSGIETSPARRAVEIAWAVLPGVALALVLTFTWRAMHPLHTATFLGFLAR
jgi:heme/copper-type cytochrome/quinol oxidase subunit 2